VVEIGLHGIVNGTNKPVQKKEELGMELLLLLDGTEK
jgi:hypothetical protein